MKKILAIAVTLVIGFTAGLLAQSVGQTPKEWALGNNLVSDIRGTDDPRWGDSVSLEELVEILWAYDGNTVPTTIPVSYTHLTLPTKRIV